MLKAADATNILLPRVEAIEALAEDGPWRGVGCPLMGKWLEVAMKTLW